MAKPVAGIAMGLIKEDDGRVAVLTDILGDEDHLGDMDFKVAGTKDGVTALQMDIKITSITKEIMQTALAQAHEGRIHILGEMAKAISEPRPKVSPLAPGLWQLRFRLIKFVRLSVPAARLFARLSKRPTPKLISAMTALLRLHP